MDIEIKIEERIEKWKKSLLDTTKRNRLYHYKPLKVGSLELLPETFDEEIEDVILEVNKLLLGNIEYFTFTSYTEREDEDIDKDSENKDLHEREEFIRKRSSSLNRIKQKISQEEEEKGLSIGYIAVGFLNWKESKDSEVFIKTPLIMIPIKINQNGRRSSFKVVMNEHEQIRINPVIVKKLFEDFNVDIRDIINYKEDANLSDTNKYSLEFLLNEIEKEVSFDKAWSLSREVVIDTFNFQNFVIWDDMDKNRETIIKNPFIRVLTGADRIEEGFLYQEGEIELDKARSVDNLNIYEVDSSQQEAIYRAKNGESFVIQGPPGTGKSQTITNIIAEMLFLGKKILFVSEKRAALDVVYNKLDIKGLAGSCLILHNSKQRRADVREQIATTLHETESIQKIKDNVMYTYDDYDNKKHLLNKYGNELHEELDNKITPYFILGELNKLDKVKELIFNFPDDFDWSSDYHNKLQKMFMDINKYAESFIDNNQHFKNNYWKYYKGVFDNTTQREVQENIGDITEQRIEKNSNITLDKLDDIVEYFKILNKIPFEQSNHEDLKETVSIIKDEERNKKELEEESKSLDNQIRNLFTEIEPYFNNEIISFEEIEKILSKLKDKYKTFLDRYIKDFKDYKDTIKKIENFSIKKMKYLDYVSNLEKVLDIRKKKEELKANNLKLESKDNEIKTIFEKLKLSIKSKNQKIYDLLHNLDYAQYTEYYRHYIEKNNLLNIYKFHSFVSEIESENQILTTEEISNVFKKRFLKILLEKTNFDKNYSKYYAQEHDGDVNLFKEYDKRALEINSKRIKCQLSSRRPLIGGFSNEKLSGEVGKLKRILKERKRMISTRKLIEMAPNVLPQFMPCMMMSPLTVSSYFGSNKDWYFDVVIFDEASQVKPGNAITSIIRGNQIIVAGDAKQMPPTNFFDASEYDDYDEEYFENYDLESILDEMSASFDDIYLNWHYRSKDESLITFSNKNFYNSRLATFPSPTQKNEESGVKFVYCDNGIWENSRDGNKKEAEKVALLVLEHFKNHPKDSLGVVAFGKGQSEAIESSINKLRDLNPDLEEFFNDSNPEPFFIKNLENVQGDERDKIILSCAYGKGPDGKFAMRFGPLASEGGERRLNVAVSRAKKSMIVVASFKAHEIRGVENNHQRKLLRDFIDYAEHGSKALLGEINEKEYFPTFDSGFEEEVYYFLEAKGYKLRTQVGESGYKIDIGVFHPEIEGRYILAIECDGAMYHSSRTARDRDIQRQEILESLGWKFHRIWSTDWYHDKARAKQKLLDAIEYAKNNYGKELNIKKEKIKDEEVFITIVSDVDKELQNTYYKWNKKIKKDFYYYGSEWNNLSNIIRSQESICYLFKEIIKYKNGHNLEDIFREINLKVFEKKRCTQKTIDILKTIFINCIVDKNIATVTNGTIKLI